MSNVSVERYDDFTGGLNLRADQFQLATNESPDMLNVEIDPRGGLFTRGAMREINSTAIPYVTSWTPQKLYPFSGETPNLMLTTTNRVFKSTGGDFSVLEYSAGNPVVPQQEHGACFAQWGNTLYMVVGTSGNGGYKWDSASTYATALTASGTNPHDWQDYGHPIGGKIPTAQHIIVHANKMFVANTTENGVHYPNRLRWSHEGLPEDWLQADYIDFEGGGLGITGIAVVAGQLVVFKPNSIYIVYGYETSDFQVVQLSANLGCGSHDWIATSEVGVYFYSHPFGLYYYNGTTVVDLFENIRPIYPLGYINDASDDNISVSYVNKRVWVSLPYSKTTLATTSTISFVYDPTIGNGSWVSHKTADGYGVIGGCNFVNSSGVGASYMIHPTLPRVLKIEVYDEEKDLIGATQQSFDSYYRTGWVDGRSYSQKKMFRRPDIVVKQADTSRILNIKVYHNFEEALGNERKNFNLVLPASGRGMKWGYGQWGQDKWGVIAEGAQVLRGSNLGLARSVQLLFTGPTGLAWGIDSISYKYNTRKVTG